MTHKKLAQAQSLASILAPGFVAEDGADAWPIEIRDLDSLGVLAHIWDELGLTEVINQNVPVDEQVELQPGLALKALVLNIVGGRAPLYRVQHWAEQIPVEMVVGQNVQSSQLNDTTLGRHLDRLFEADGESVFNAACLRVIEKEGISLQQMHADTTSRLVFGAYQHEEDDAISITRGHSKDKRPDLKQVMYGITVSPEGIPLVGQLLSGNTSDKIWHGGMLDVVHRCLKTDGKQPIHYVGDSALVTENNFRIASEHGIVLTSRLPRTLSITDEVVLRALNESRFEDIGRFSDSTRASRYEGCVFEDYEVYGQPVQLGVFRATPANERTRKAVMHRREKLLKKAQKAAAKLMKTDFFCEADARHALQAFETEHFASSKGDHLLQMNAELVEERVPQKRKRGRPRKGETPQMEARFRVRIELTEDEKVSESVIARQSCFVLVHTGAEPITAHSMMATYKKQSAAETRFPFLKDPAWADVFFLKTPHRIEALGYVLLLALLLWSLWERRVRGNLLASKEPPLVDTTGMKKAKPTAMVCRHILAGMKVMRLRTAEGVSPWHLTAPIGSEQARVLRFSQKLAGQKFRLKENRALLE